VKQKLFYFFFIVFIISGIHSVAQQPRLVLPIGHTDDITVSTFSPDGRILLTAADDNTVKLWEAATGSLLLDFTAHKSDVKQARFSGDGSMVLSVDDDGIAKLWLLSGLVLLDMQESSEAVYFAGFSADNKHLITAVFDSVFIREISTGKIVSRFFTGYQSDYVLSPDAEFLATHYKDIIKVWRLITGELVKEFSGYSVFHKFCFVAGNKGLLTWSTSHTAEVKQVKEDNILIDKLNILLKNIGKPDAIAIDMLQQKAAVVGAKSGIHLLDLVAGKEITVIPPVKESRFQEACFSPDAVELYTARESADNVGEIITETWLINEKPVAAKDQATRLPGMYLGLKHFTVNAIKRNMLVGTGDPKDCYLVDLKAEKIIASLGGYSNNYYFADFNRQGNKVLAVSSQKPVIWNLQLGKPDSLLEGSISFRGLFNPAGEEILLLNGNSLSLLNTAVPGSKKKISSNKNAVNIYDAFFSEDGQKVLFWDTENVAVIWDVKRGKIIAESGILHKDIRLGGISANGKEVVAVCNDSLIFYDSGSWEIVRTFRYNWRGDAFFGAAFCKGSDRLLASTYRGKILLIDPNKGNILDSIAGKGDYLKLVQYRPDGKMILAVTKDYSIWLIDADTKIRKTIATPHQLDIKSARFSNDSRYFVTASSDNTCKLWHAADGALLATFFSIDSLNYFMSIPGGYYQASVLATKLLHYVTPDLKVISFEQLDVKYNRPDKVLEAIGNTDTALIKSYRKAWEKRIKKLGIDTTQFRDGYSVPEADFVNRDSIEYEQKTGTLRLHIKGVDSTYLLDRFNVWVNESPLFGQRGISLKTCLPVGREKCNSIDTTITIKLSQGENRIETSITNVNGTESYRMPLYVNYTPAVKQKEMTRFIGIGIDQFKESNYNLQYSSKDIRDLAVKLKEQYKDNIIIDTLFNENVTAEKVKALKERLQQTTVNDKVIVSYSGHGLLSGSLDYYLSTYTINFNKPEENGLPYDELENLLDSIPARKKLLLIDACHSGEVDKEEGIAMNKLADSLGLAKGIIIEQTQTQQQHVGLKNSFELMQSLFVNVGKSTGATIISAAAGNQFALERGDLKNGVFTYSILEAMNKYPTIKISELKKIVGERVEQLTNGMQKPTSRNETIAVDWSIW
jgi:WD40 repeat protein